MALAFPLLSASEVKCLKDGYCNFCGKTTDALLPTNDSKAMCLECTDRKGFCEICGSYREDDEGPDDQLHYEEECFK